MKTVTKALIVASLALATLGQAEAGERRHSWYGSSSHDYPPVIVYRGHNWRGASHWAHKRHHDYRVNKRYWNNHRYWRDRYDDHDYGYYYPRNRSSGTLIFRW